VVPGPALAAHLALIAGLTAATGGEETGVAPPAKVKFFTRRDPLLANEGGMGRWR